MTLVGFSGLLLTSCARLRMSPTSSSQDLAIHEAISEKNIFISKLNLLADINPNLFSELKIVVEQTEKHVSALERFLVTDIPQTSFSPSPTTETSLASLAVTCLQFSNNHLELARKSDNAEISRTFALIGGSEVQHHHLLSGLKS